MDAMVLESARDVTPLLDRVRTHLAGDPEHMPIVAEEFESYEHPNVQVAIDHALSTAGRTTQLVGLAVQNKRFMTLTFSDLLASTFNRFAEGPVDYVNFHLEGDRVLACVQFGLYFVTERTRTFCVFVAGPPNPNAGPQTRMRVEVIGRERDASAAVAREIVAAMREGNVYRGKVISLSPGQYGVQALVRFHQLPRVAADAIVFPAGLLERIDRHTVEFSKQAPRLRAAGRALRRGMLLYGPPGVGKTLTIMYLNTRMPGRTLILTTGFGLGMIGTIGRFAKELAPSTVVVEDVDLIAQERGFPGVQTQPLLFELLNQMDGLDDDADVLFVLTTNRPDILEPALAARPGRVDLVVELPLPDAEGRRRLLELYARGLPLDGVDLGAYVERIDSASPAYIKELLRRAALLAALENNDTITVGSAHLDQAIEELASGGELAKRIVGFGGAPFAPLAPASIGPMRGAGFPPVTKQSRSSPG